MTIWRMSFAYWILKATDTHLEHVILIPFFHGNNSYSNAPQFSVYTYIACHVERRISIGQVCHLSALAENFRGSKHISVCVLLKTVGPLFI
jgi:hypothetical protein